MWAFLFCKNILENIRMSAITDQSLFVISHIYLQFPRVSMYCVYNFPLQKHNREQISLTSRVQKRDERYQNILTTPWLEREKKKNKQTNDSTHDTVNVYLFRLTDVPMETLLYTLSWYIFLLEEIFYTIYSVRNIYWHSWQHNIEN